MIPGQDIIDALEDGPKDFRTILKALYPAVDSRPVAERRIIRKRVRLQLDQMIKDGTIRTRPKNGVILTRYDYQLVKRSGL